MSSPPSFGSDNSAQTRKIRAAISRGIRDGLQEVRALLESLEERVAELETSTEEAHETALVALQGLASDRREMFELLTALDTSAKATA